MDPRLRFAPVELRADADSGEGTVTGYASVFDTEYRIGWGLKEAIRAGAFADSIQRRDGVVPLFYQHDWDEPIGVARVSEDAKGLKVEAELFVEDNERARSVWRGTKAGAFREWSIGFIPEEIVVERAADDVELEAVTRADLLECSLVVKGANPDTAVTSVRAEPAEEPPAIPAELLARIHEPHVRDAIRARLATSV